VLGEPAQPAAERSPVFVDGDDAWAWGAVEGPVGEYEAEGWEVFDQGAGLGAEDVAVDAAAVEAEDAGVMEGWVWGCFCCRCHGWVVGGDVVVDVDGYGFRWW